MNFPYYIKSYCEHLKIIAFFPNYSQILNTHTHTHRAITVVIYLKDSLEEVMATCSSILVWRIPWTEGPSGLQSIVFPRRWECLKFWPLFFPHIRPFHNWNEFSVFSLNFAWNMKKKISSPIHVFPCKPNYIFLIPLSSYTVLISYILVPYNLTPLSSHIIFLKSNICIFLHSSVSLSNLSNWNSSSLFLTHFPPS